MKVSEWLEQQGLTVDSEMPDSIMTSRLKVPEEIMDGLSDEGKTNARCIARDSGDMELVNTYISWLKAGDVAMFNTGSTASEALEKIIKDGSIYFYEKVVPAKPFEYFSFRNSLASYVVAMRFVKVE